MLDQVVELRNGAYVQDKPLDHSSITLQLQALVKTLIWWLVLPSLALLHGGARLPKAAAAASIV